MAKPSLDLVTVIRKAAQNLQVSSAYQWGHMGCCNCGFIAQVVTSLSKSEIHRRAMLRHGDWSEQLNDYCPPSGQPMDDMISELIAFGFDTEDLKHLERLSDSQILEKIPGMTLEFNVKEDVVKYLQIMAEIVESKLLAEVILPSFEKAMPLRELE